MLKTSKSVLIISLTGTLALMGLTSLTACQSPTYNNDLNTLESTENYKLLINKFYITQEALDSELEYALTRQNYEHVTAYQDKLVNEDEVLNDVMYSKHVDYYLGQIENGGFSQFVYNTGWNPQTIAYVRSGLKKMGADKNSKLFNKMADILNGFSDEQFEKFMHGDYWGENAERDLLDAFDDEFYSLQENEDLLAINNAWIRNHPQLQVVSKAEFQAITDDLTNKIPDLEKRLKKIEENQPRYTKLISALCEQVGYELKKVTAGDPTHEYENKPMLAWHFITDKGHFYMLDFEDYAVMFDDNDKEVLRIDGKIK